MNPGILKKIYHGIFPTYIHVLRREIEGMRSLVEMGSGKTSPFRHVNFKGESVGIDIDRESINESRKRNIHKKYILGDVLKVRIKENSYDCAVALDLIEHLSKKDGYKLIKKMLSISWKKVIIFTPNGFLPQGEIAGNPFQKHLSGWSVKEFKRHGFKVKGINGIKFLRGGEARIKYRPKLLWTIISEISQLFTYFIPSAAFQIIAIKEKK